MIGIIGLSHKSAPVHIREQFSLNKEKSKELAKRICESRQIDALLILSTCNRTEFYYRAKSSSRDIVNMIIIKHLIAFTGAIECKKEYFYGYEYKDAVNHLFRVVSSLESMVLGEYQIVSQIKDAFNNANENETLNTELKRLFNKALETGKIIRTRTEMSSGAFSVSYAAIEKCSQTFKNLPKKKILLVGAGETGELVVRSLYKKSCNNITIANRTLIKAQELARKYNANVVEYRNLNDAISKSDIIITAVSTDKYIINNTLSIHQQLFIDLGVPRNINPDIVKKNIYLVNIDDLQTVVADNQEKKQALIATAEEIIEEKVNEFLDWLSGRNLAPAIKNIIHAVSTLQKKELKIFERKCDTEEMKKIKKYSQHYSEKLVNDMIKNLKILSDNGRHTDYIKVIENLFSEIE